MNHIKLCRNAAGLTQEDLAALLGVTQNTVSAWENDIQLPSAYCVVSMSYLFSMPCDFFLDDFRRFRFDELRMSRIPFVLHFDPLDYKE